MENNWKWYEQQNSQQQDAQQNTQPSDQQQQQQQGQPNYGQYQYTYTQNTSNAYNANGSGSGSNGNGGGKKPKKFVTMTQMMVTVIVAALLFTGAGLAIGKAISANNTSADQQQLAMNSTTSEPTVTSEVTTNETTTSNAISDTPSSTTTVTETPTTQPSTGLKTSDATNTSSSSTSVVQACMSSVVSIDIEQNTTSSSSYYWYSQGQSSTESESETVGSGSGVIVTSDGYIVTNNHVVSGADGIKVYLQDGTEYDAQLVGTDSYTDIAVIKIDAENLPAATIGSSSSMMVGDTVYAIGNPLGVLATSVSKGIISGLDREVTIDGQQMTLMQVNASVNSGNSGGGLFNEEGELIGIVNAKANGTNVEGIGFAIPIDTAKGVITDLMDLGYVTGRPYLGITMQNVAFTTGNAGGYGGFYGNYGGYGYTTHPQIYSIESGSAAEKAGLKVNDIILYFDGQEITSSSDLSALLYNYNVGDTVTMTVQRGSEQVDISIVLGERQS